MCKKECQPGDNLEADCKFCLEYTGPGGESCSKPVNYTSYYPCQECKNGVISSKTRPCKTCNPPTIENGALEVTANGSIKINKSNLWTDKLNDTSEDGGHRSTENCYICKDVGGVEKWVLKCPDNTTCRNGKCEPDCNPPCNTLCQKCECKKRGGPGSTKCILSYCESLLECTLPGYGCYSPPGFEELGGCQCLLVPFALGAPPAGKQRCPEDKPSVVDIVNEIFGITTNAGCECRCNITAQTCLDQSKVFDAKACMCKPQCDPPCDPNKCETCVKRDGVFGCYSKCPPGKACDGEGNCYQPPPSLLSLDTIP